MTQEKAKVEAKEKKSTRLLFQITVDEVEGSKIPGITPKSSTADIRKAVWDHLGIERNTRKSNAKMSLAMELGINNADKMTQGQFLAAVQDKVKK